MQGSEVLDRSTSTSTPTRVSIDVSGWEVTDGDLAALLESAAASLRASGETVAKNTSQVFREVVTGDLFDLAHRS